MKNICFCNSTRAWGGGEKWHLEAALAFAKRGWKVFLLCHPEGKLYQEANEFTEICKVPINIGRFSFLYPPHKKRIADFLRKENITSLIMNLPSDLKVVAPVAHKLGVKHIWFRRGSAIAVKNSWLNRHLYSLLTGVLVNSQATRAMLLVNNPHFLAAQRIHLLSNGIDTTHFIKEYAAVNEAEKKIFLNTYLPEKNNKGNESRQKDRVEEKVLRDESEFKEKAPLIIGNAGRLNRQKGQEYLVYLAKILEEKQTDFYILIAGTGERLQELQNLSCALGVEHRVFFVGFHKNLATFWRSIDVFVLTSRWEGFGYVVLEAMLAQKPVYAFNASNMPELITEGKSGYLFALPNEREKPTYPSLHAMAESIIQLKNNPKLQKQLGAYGFTQAQTYDQEKKMDELENLLR